MKIMYVFYLIVFGLFYSCKEQVVEQLPDEQGIITNTTQNNPGLVGGSCIPGTNTYQSCVQFKSNSSVASIVHTCLPDGKSQISSECMVQSCQPGFTNINNVCVQSQCSPYSRTTENCTAEVSGAASATRQVVCSGQGFVQSYGVCEISSCLPSHYRQGNACRPKVCTQSEEKIDCSHLKDNSSKASITKICNAEGSSVTMGSCQVEACLPGYVKAGNQCVPKVCEPNLPPEEISCTNLVPNSMIAIRTATCNTIGNYKTYSSCNLVQCRNGFKKDGNTCIPLACTPNEVKTISCAGEIPNARTASKQQICNSSGSNATYSTCELKGCLNGFMLSNDGKSCIPQVCIPNNQRVESCSIANASSAQEIFQCNSNGSAETLQTSCTVKSCITGFVQDGNSCISKVCEPYQITSRSCNKNNAANAFANFQCNSEGTSETQVGECVIANCNANYHLDTNTNTCVQNVCSPNSQRTETSCHVAGTMGIASSSRVLTCNPQGSGETAGQCNIVCSSGFKLNNLGNACVASSEETPGDNGNSQYKVVDFLPAPSQEKMTCKQWLAENGQSPPNSYDFRSIEINITSGNSDIPNTENCAYEVKMKGSSTVYCESKSFDMSTFQGTWDLYSIIKPVAECKLSSTKKLQTNVFISDLNDNGGDDNGNEDNGNGGNENNESGTRFIDLANWSPQLIPASATKILCKDWLQANNITITNANQIRTHKWLSGSNYDLPETKKCAYKIQYTAGGETFCESRSWDDLDFRNGLWEQLYSIKPTKFCDTQNGNTNTRYKTSALFIENNDSNDEETEPNSNVVTEWIDFGQAENRKIVFDSNSSTHAYAAEGQSCSEWFISKQIDVKQMGVVTEYKDGGHLHFWNSKFNGVAYHAQEHKPDRFNQNQCLYRVQFKNGRVHCTEASLTKSFNEVSTSERNRYKDENGIDQVDNIRAVAICDATQAGEIAEARNKIAFQQRLQIKLNKARTTRAVLLDDRFFDSIGKAHVPTGNAGESAIEFFVRLGIDPYMNYPSKDLFLKITHGDSYQEKDLADNNLSFANRMNHKNSIETGSMTCAYESVNLSATNGIPCKQAICNTKDSNWKPSLSCSWNWDTNTANVGGQLRFKFEMGVFDSKFQTDTGHSLNSPQKVVEIGLSSRSGGTNQTAAAWLESQGVKFTELKTFTENLDPYYAYMQANNISQTGTEYNRLVRENYCPYEIRDKGDGTPFTTGALKSCVTHLCNELPSFNSDTEYVVPVTSCNQFFTEGMAFGTIDTFQSYFKRSLHIIGNDISGSSNINNEDDGNDGNDGNEDDENGNTGSRFVDLSNWSYQLQAPIGNKVLCKNWLEENNIIIRMGNQVRSHKWLSGKNYDIPVDAKCAYRIQYTAGGETFCESRSWNDADFRNGLWGQLYSIQPVAFCDTQNGNTNTRYKTSVFNYFVDLSNWSHQLTPPTANKTLCKDWLQANNINITNANQVRSHKWLSGNNYDFPDTKKCAYRIQYTAGGETFCESRSWDDVDFRNGLWEQLYSIQPTTFCDTQNGNSNTRYKTDVFLWNN